MSMVERLNQTKKGSGRGYEVGGRNIFPNFLNQIFGPDPGSTHSFLGSQTPSLRGYWEEDTMGHFQMDQNPGHRRKEEPKKS